MSECPAMTTAAGTPVADNQNSQTAGPRGPLLMQDYQLMEKMAHFKSRASTGACGACQGGRCLRHVNDSR